MISIQELNGKYTGLPAAVLGGGPSLWHDMTRLPKDTILISVNHHALRLCDPHFLIYMDKASEFSDLEQALVKYKGIKVSPNLGSDVDLKGANWWDGGMSSALATWLACWLGCDPVLLCGMDCYQGERKYFYDRVGFYHPCFDFPLENHLNAWRPALQRCPNAGAIRAVSGPLVQVFGAYD